MAPPRTTLWKLKPHSLAKHEILRRYIDAWLPIMTKWNLRLLLVDGFAGPGVYKDGEPGSPIIMLQAFLGHQLRMRMGRCELIYVFVEEDSRRVDRLHYEIGQLGPMPPNVRIDVIHGAYEDEFSNIIAAIEQEGEELAPTFAFIDPFGYSDVSMSLTGRFLQFEQCEVLTYMPLKSVCRWVREPEQEKALDSLFGCGEWRSARDLIGKERSAFLHDLFRDQLHHECGLKYVRSFEIISAARNSGYHLFFGSGDLRGLDKMKFAMWSVDRVAGQQFRDTTNLNQVILFELEVDTGPLAQALRNHFGTNPFTIEQAWEFTLVDTLFHPDIHLKKQTLRPLEKDEGLLEVLTDRSRRWTYPRGTAMRFVQ